MEPHATTPALVEELLDSLGIAHGPITLRAENYNLGYGDGSSVWVKVTVDSNGQTLRQELEATTALLALGLIAPRSLSPVVHHLDGIEQDASVWRYFEHEKFVPTVDGVVEAAEHLMDIHRTAPDIAAPPLDLGLVMAVIFERLDPLPGHEPLDLMHHARRVALLMHDALGRTASKPQFTHADAHVGNIVRHDGRAIFIDWEGSKTATREFDLSKLVPPGLDGTMACGTIPLTEEDSFTAWATIRSLAPNLDMRLVRAAGLMRIVGVSAFALRWHGDVEAARRAIEYLDRDETEGISRYW